MDKPRSPTLRERIGGRWAVSWPAFIICLSFTSLSRLLDPLFAQPSVRMFGLLIDLVTFLVCFGGTMWLSTITVLRNRRVRPVPVALVAAVGFVAAASVIVAQDLVVTFVGMDGPGYVSRPWLVAAITGAIALCSIAYLLDARERFRSERDRLLTTLARSVDADATEQEALDLLRSQMWQYAASDAASALPSGATSTNDEDSLGEARSVVIALRSSSDRALRSLSHGMWTPERSGRLRPMMAIRALAAQQPYQLPLLAFPLFIFTTLRLTQSEPVTIQLVSLALLAAYGSAVSITVNAATRMAPHFAVAVVIGSVPVLALSCIPLYFVLVQTGGDNRIALRLALAGALWLAGVYPLFNLARGLSIAREDLVLGLRQSITEGDVRRASRAHDLEELRREIAMHLHGTVRGLLTTTVMRLEFAISSRDSEQARLALSEARALLERAGNSPSSIGAPDLAAASSSMLAELSELQSAWSGLVDVRIHADADPAPDDSAKRKLLSIVTEGINDAARHGQATCIEVTIRHRPDGWEVIVDDNGSTDTTLVGAATGLGSQYLDAVAADGWSRVRTRDNLTRLRVSVKSREDHVTP